MSTDQPSSAEANQASVDPVISDYFQATATPDKAAAEQVPSSGKEEKTTDADPTKEKTSEGKPDDKSKSDDKSKDTEEKKTTPTKPTEGQDAKDKKEEDGAQLPTEYEVGGRKYKSLDKAIEAVNKINGKNTELVGDKRKLETEKGELQDQIKTLTDRLSALEAANKQWKEYYDGNGEKPEDVIDIDAKIEEKLTLKEKKKLEKETQEKFAKELDEIFDEDDFKEVQPFFKSIIDEYDGTPKVSPKKLYERARREYKSSLKGDNPEEDEDYQKAVEEGIKKALAKREASKETPASGGSSKAPSQNVSPEIADYFNSR